jgi:hypothetical protein
MCKDLDMAMEVQKELGGADTTKGAIMLFKAAAKSMNKLSEKMDTHITEADNRWKMVDEKLENLQKSFDEYKTDAAKYRLIVELIKALFGTTKRSIVTLVWFGVLFGIFHLRDLLEVLKTLI